MKLACKACDKVITYEIFANLVGDKCSECGRTREELIKLQEYKVDEMQGSYSKEYSCCNEILEYKYVCPKCKHETEFPDCECERGCKCEECGFSESHVCPEVWFDVLHPPKWIKCDYRNCAYEIADKCNVSDDSKESGEFADKHIVPIIKKYFQK